MKAVVTGGAGFIGSNLAHALLQQQHEVVVIDNLATGHSQNVSEKAQFLHGSVTDPAVLAQAFEGADVVFHQAALGSVPRSIADPVASNEANVVGTLQVLEAARKFDVSKVVFAASSSAYGNTPTLPKVETMTPAPRSPYAVSKLAGESYCSVFWQVYGLRTTSLRYFNVYGPRQDPNGAYAAVIPRFIMAALRGQPLTILGDGSQTRDFTYVEDVVRANLLASGSRAADGRVINIGAGGRTSLRDLAHLIISAAKSESAIRFDPPRKGDVQDSLAGLQLARELLGYSPKVDIATGIRSTVAWFRENLK
jgi:UDP-glucose 4-epimerase